MKWKHVGAIVLCGGLLIILIKYAAREPQSVSVLTGIVTTNHIVVSSQIDGRIGQMLVNEGDSVQPDQVMAIITQGELPAEYQYFERSADALASQIEAGTANVATAIAVDSETSADLAYAHDVLERDEALYKTGGVTMQERDRARSDYAIAKARADAAGAGVAASRSALTASRHAHAAAAAQAAKAKLRLSY